MDRSTFLKLFPALALTPGVLKASALNRLTETLAPTDRMPALFVGHGSPMNALESNPDTQGWIAAAKALPKPTAILCVSAHWLTRGTFVTAMEQPRTIHDFGGFPQALFDVQYPAPGSPNTAKAVQDLVTKTHVGADDHEWGLDHGTWSILKQMFPDADVPVIQLSIDYYQDARYQYELGQQLQELRNRGLLIVGSGNIVHNLRMARFGPNPQPYDWAIEFDEQMRGLLAKGDIDSVLNWKSLGEAAKLSVPTPDHLQPLFYILGLQKKGESLKFFNETMAFGSGSMRSIRIG